MQYGAPIYVYDFGANGTERDPQGRIVLCAHGDRQIVRLEQDGTRTVLAPDTRAPRFYHPNEMTIKSDGAIYITMHTRLPRIPRRRRKNSASS